MRLLSILARSLAAAWLALGGWCAAERTRLRVTLGADEAVEWVGELSTDRGRLERLQPLSLDPGVAAAIVEDSGAVTLRAGTPRKLDTFDITVAGPRDAVLRFRSGGASDAAESAASIELAAVRREPQAVALGGGRWLHVQRPTVDRMRLRTERRSLLFDPGETFTFDLLSEPADVGAGDEYELSATLARGRTGGAVWRSEPLRVRHDGEPTTTAFDIPLPSEEGVYRVMLEARRPAGISSRFFPQTGDATLARREVQLAVVDADARRGPPGSWRPAYTFDARSHHWSERLPEWIRRRRLPGLPALAEDPLSSVSTATRHTDRVRAIKLPAAPEARAAHWVAYPLPTPRVGDAYAVEVEHLGNPDDESAPAPLTLAIVEPDALGGLRPSGPAVTAIRPRWNRSESASTARLNFRPRTSTPLLVIANPATDAPARFGAIRLLESAGIAEARVPNPTRRAVALDWSDADLPHAVGASHRRSADGPYETPDLVTWWETARSVADRVQRAGANAAVISVNQSGAAILPSRVWPGVRRDLAVWGDASVDVPRREALRLIVREFESRGLGLIAAVRFDARSPQPTDDSASAAAARRAAIDEVLDAIGDSPAFRAVAVRTTPDGWGVPIDGSKSRDERLADAYRELVQHVARRTGRSEALIVLPAASLGDRRLAEGLRPRLGDSAGDMPSTPLATLAGSLSLRVARPHGVGPLAGGFDPRATDATFALFRKTLGEPAARPAWSVHAASTSLRLVSSGDRLTSSGAGSQRDVTMLTVSQDAMQQRAWLAAAATADATLVVLDGPLAAGWQDAATTRAVAALSALPVGDDRAAAITSQRDGEVEARVVTPASSDPLTVADNADAGSSDAASLLVTNRSAWPRTAHVTVEVDERSRTAEQIDDPAAEPDAEWLSPGRHVLTLRLDAHATRRRSFRPGAVRVVGVRTEPNARASRELSEAVAELQSRDTTTRRRTRRIANASFEELDGDKPIAWAGSEGVRSDDSAATDGNRGLRFTASDQAPAVALSEPFAAPPTGELVLGMRARPERLGAASELILQVEDVVGRYRRETRLNAAALGVDASGVVPPEAAASWRPIVLPLDDVPIGGEPLRLRIVLRGEGELAIDDVSTEDVLLPLDAAGLLSLRSEKLAIVGLLTAAESALAEGRLEACRRLLDGYAARYLAGNFPRREDDRDGVNDLASDASDGSAEGDEATEATESLDDTPLTVGERLRQYLPGWWR